MKVVIANDTSGYALKKEVIKALSDDGYSIIDMGTDSPDEFLSHVSAAERVAEMISRGEAEKGILFCGTGMGVAITANKYKGVYAAVCETVFTAQRARYINDCNVLCMGGFVIAPVLGVAMAREFLCSEFGEKEFGSESTKKFLRMQYDAITCIEEKNFK